MTAIEWTDVTWNPTVGCTRVSPGCDSCYAIRQARIRSGSPHPAIAAAYDGTVERRDGRLDWTGRVNTLPDRLDAPLHWRAPRRVFVDSMSDLFHDQVPDEYIARVFAVMQLADQHVFQLLTKRHGRMRSLLRRAPGRDFLGMVDEAREQMRPGCGDFTWPLPNVWLGVSVEDQQRADLRIPALLDTPAAVRFLSCEPMVGEVDLQNWLYHAPWSYTEFGVLCDCGSAMRDEVCQGPQIGWVIAGGESGPGARPMHPDWARLLRDQCIETDTPFLFKQWGGRTAKDGGRELDGHTWDQYPTTAAALP